MRHDSSGLASELMLAALVLTALVIVPSVHGVRSRDDLESVLNFACCVVATASLALATRWQFEP